MLCVLNVVLKYVMNASSWLGCAQRRVYTCTTFGVQGRVYTCTTFGLHMYRVYVQMYKVVHVCTHVRGWCSDVVCTYVHTSYTKC